MNTTPTWTPTEIRTGIINPSTGKEYILSNYYVDEDGNKHFTHTEALAIAERVPGWRLCDDEFHNALYKAVWDKEAGYWRNNVLGSGLNGFEYMTKKLGYERGGYRRKAKTNGTLYGIGNGGYSWSSTPNGSSARYLDFYYGGISPQGTTYRAYGLQVRLIKE